MINTIINKLKCTRNLFTKKKDFKKNKLYQKGDYIYKCLEDTDDPPQLFHINWIQVYVVNN